VGPEVERLFNTKRFLSMYFISGIAGNILGSLASNSPGVGASGCIAGLIGGYYIFVKQNTRVLSEASVQNSLNNLHRSAALNVMIGLSNSNIDNYAHLGGAAAGALASYAYGPRLSYSFSGIVDHPRLQLSDGKKLFAAMGIDGSKLFKRSARTKRGGMLRR
jgi:membrane associated rhomboid family serine protease